MSQIALNKDILEAVKFGTAVSASKVSSGMSSGFSHDQVEKFLDEIKIEKIK